jgi:transposase
MKLLKDTEREDLKRQHRREKDRRRADKIKTILLLDKEIPYEKIAEFLFLDDETIRRYEREFREKGIEGLLETDYKGKACNLTYEQQEELKDHLRENVY